ncbi:zinc finger protein 346-like [Hippocampus comes]|uniref:zinc finger protein 346-like n=1 Tax=Hippocampus comes TaxID=109280 RepID=UPI00094F06A2|nr:PREDICTED: zinc finger protein 346-like [Hippocampus comes]
MMAVAMDTDQFPYLPSGPDQVNQMIKEHGNLFTDSLCSVCNAVLISESQKLAHYQSKKHGNKVRRYLSIQSENEPETKKFKSLSSVSHDTNNGESDPMKACKMCKMTFTSPVMAQSHYQGKIHAKNLKLKSVDPHTLAQQAAPAPSKKKAAAAAAVVLPAAVNQMIKEHGNLFTDSLCSVCNAVLISESQKLAHYQSKKHGNKVRRYLSIQSENEPETKKFKSLSSVSHDTNNGESDPMKACKMCKMTFTSPVMAQSHYQGKIHAKNLKLKSVDPHTLAQQAAPAPSKKKAAAAAAVVEVAAAATGNGGHGGDKDPDRFCSICQASFNNAQMAQQHYSGKKHKKHLAKQDLMKLYGKPATPAASTAKGLPCTLCNIELNSVDQYQSHISGAKHKNQMKKSGLTPSDSQQASAPQNERRDRDEQSAGNDEDDDDDDEQPGNGSYQGGLPSQLLASGEDQDFVTEDNLFETEDNFFGIGGDIFSAADDQYDEDS